VGDRARDPAAPGRIKPNELTVIAEDLISLDWHLRLRSAGGRASVGNSRENCVADDVSSTPADRSRQPRTNTRKCGDQPAHQSLLNRRLDGSAAGPAQSLHLAAPSSCPGIAHPHPSSLTTNIRVLTGNRMSVIRGYALTVGDGSALLLRLAIQKEEYVSPPFWATTRPTSKTEGEQCA
jgi:hypothetical protein